MANTRQMLAASWGKPEAYCYIILKQSACILYNTNCIHAVYSKYRSLENFRLELFRC